MAIGNIQATLEEMRDILDINHMSWMPLRDELFIEGEEIEKYEDGVAVYYFADKLPVPFARPRESLYAKVRKDLPKGENGEDQGFLLSFRSVSHEKHPLNHKYVRVKLKYALYIVPDKVNGGVIYTVTQIVGKFFFF
jgi:hypothetical protein